MPALVRRSLQAKENTGPVSPMRNKVSKLSISPMEKWLFICLCMKPTAVSLSAMALFCKKEAKPDQCHLVVDLLAQIGVILGKKILGILLALNR